MRLFKLLSSVKILFFLIGDLLCHVLKALKFTETFTSELGLDKGYFERIYGTLFFLVMPVQVPSISSSIVSVKTILLVVMKVLLLFLFLI